MKDRSWIFTGNDEFSSWLREIVIPQAVRVALPPLFNDIINLIKMTSLAFYSSGVPDIMGAAKI